MCTQLLGWDLAVRWGVARCFGQLSHDHRGLSRALASDRQAPLQMACGGKQSRDPPCWFIRIQSHLAEDWSCHWPFQRWNTEVLFCTFIELHSVLSGQYTPLHGKVHRARHVTCAHSKSWCSRSTGMGRGWCFPGKTILALRWQHFYSFLSLT